MDFLSPEEMSEEELQQLMALGIIPDQQALLEKQRTLAEQLRYRNAPEMRGNARVQTAANPLEFLVSGIQGYKAGKELDEIKKKNDDLLQQQVSGRKAFYEALRRRSANAGQPQGLGMMPSQEEYL